MKRLFLLPLLGFSVFYNACRSPEVVPEPEEYFSFYADGVFYDYPQVIGWGGSTRTLETYKVGTTRYKISGRQKENPRGLISMSFPGAHIPDNDTIILNSAAISDFTDDVLDYSLEPPLTGKIIFTKRTKEKLEGTFEFEAFQIVYDEKGNDTLTDNIINPTCQFAIKKGSFLCFLCVL